MARARSTGRSGYDTSALRHSYAGDLAQCEFAQATIHTNGVSASRPARSISQEMIAQRAYEIYEESGCEPGRCKQNWTQAQIDLSRRSEGGV